MGRPRLHELLGVENLEGLADVFLFGASLGHVRMRPDGYHFDFIPTGAFVPDPGAVLTSQRWSGIPGELRHEEAALLLYVPLGSPGLPPLSRTVGRAVVLGDPLAVERAIGRLDSACSIVGIVEPVERTPLAGAALGAEASTPTPEEIEAAELREPPPVARVAERRRTVSPLLVVLLLIVVALIGWFLYKAFLQEPAPEPPPEPVVSEQPAEPAPQPAPAPEPVETPIPISVAVEAHQDLNTARQRVAQLQRAEPGISFYLAPLAVGGDLYYRLLAGPVTDREAGTALMQRLVDEGHKTAVDSWAVLPTRLAFQLGEYDTPEQAQARIDSLATREIPAYVVPIRYRNGPPRYRVYGGAYTSAAEAGVMKEMLDSAGVDARLVERTGEPVGGE